MLKISAQLGGGHAKQETRIKLAHSNFYTLIVSLFVFLVTYPILNNLHNVSCHSSAGHPHKSKQHASRQQRAVYMAALDREPTAAPARGLNSSEQLSTGWLYQQDQPAILDQCCACDEAKYELVFEGLWSKYTHPDDFPENYWLAYFSDMIGASHSNDFRMWAQGAFASEGVRELAETGATKRLESELKHVSSKTRTIIKARELRYPTLNSKTSAVFRTDKHHHLVSVLSKLGPSPDWMVGVSGLELCQLDCTWAAQRTVNLYLWDAGTDSGTTFTAADSPTRPQERIHPYRRQSSGLQSATSGQGTANLRSTFGGASEEEQPGGASSGVQPAISELQQPPADESVASTPSGNQALLSSGDSRKPVARLTVTRQRIYEKSCNGDLTLASHAKTSPSQENSHHQQHNHHNQHQSSPISSPIDTDMPFEAIKPPASYSDCRFTEWTDWSSCSSTCGKGIRTRTRSHLDDQADLAGCSKADLIEKEICLSECLANTTCVTRDWSEWSKCSVDCGQGYRKRTRSPIGHMRPGCGAIELVETEQCSGPCSQDERPVSHCAVTEWSEWSECPVACGTGTKIRFRQLVRKEDAKNCNVKLIQKQPCTGRPELCKQVSKANLKACSEPPETGLCRAHLIRWFYDSLKGKCQKFFYGGCGGNENNFKTIHECHKSCGADQRPMPQQFGDDAHSQGVKINPDLPVIDCKLSNWSPWSTCSAVCGTGRRTRSRYVIQMPQNGGKPCDKKLTRTQRCKDLPPCPQEYNLKGSQFSYQAPVNGPDQSRGHINHHRTAATPHQQQQQSFYKTTTTTTTPSGSMADDEDESKFSRLLKSELGHLQLMASWTPTETYVSDGAVSPVEMELIGRSSFRVRNGYIYPFDDRTDRAGHQKTV